MNRPASIIETVRENFRIATEKANRRNHEIRVPRVRVIGADGEQVGVLSRDEALSMAQDLGLDLVEIQPTADPPVCRIMDFGKFKFDAQKKAHAAKKKQKQVEIKELKFRPTTDVGDYAIKMRNLRRFLDDGDKVKITIRFRGREMAHQELGDIMVKKIAADIAEEAIIEQFPRMEGRLMVMMIAPKKK
ncbi:MAG: translation initiation factor IF-3 [Gammaproteobacteria bacterium]|nr:MAG: translation initiation factor IF-3 [Gammaproteobacteria bacterium]